MPRFDSAARFAALLGRPENGRWLTAPTEPSARVDTLILETTFETEHGAATLDFMPASEGESDLVRLVVGRRGRLDFRTDLLIRFDQGVCAPWLSGVEQETGVQDTAGPTHGAGIAKMRGRRSSW